MIWLILLEILYFVTSLVNGESLVIVLDFINDFLFANSGSWTTCTTSILTCFWRSLITSDSADDTDGSSGIYLVMNKFSPIGSDYAFIVSKYNKVLIEIGLVDLKIDINVVLKFNFKK